MESEKEGEDGLVGVSREYSLWQRRVGRHARVQHTPSCLQTSQELIGLSLFQPKSNLERVKNVMFYLFCCKGLHVDSIPKLKQLTNNEVAILKLNPSSSNG